MALCDYHICMEWPKTNEKVGKNRVVLKISLKLYTLEVQCIYMPTIPNMAILDILRGCNLCRHLANGMPCPNETIYFRSNNSKQWSTPTTTGLIERLKKQHTTFVNWCYCLREVLFQKMFVCCLQVCLAWTTILLPNSQGDSQKHVQFSQGVPVWRMIKLSNAI